MRPSFLLIVTTLITIPEAYTQESQSGEFKADISSEGWTLASGAGERTHIVFVKFGAPFKAEPSIAISVTDYQATSGRDGSVYLAVTSENVTKDGFVVKIQTWSESKVTKVAGSWTASSR